MGCTWSQDELAVDTDRYIDHIQNGNTSYQIQRHDHNNVMIEVNPDFSFLTSDDIKECIGDINWNRFIQLYKQCSNKGFIIGSVLLTYYVYKHYRIVPYMKMSELDGFHVTVPLDGAYVTYTFNIFL